ncbi:MAG: PRC-barrel domain-containing protein [archaeon]|nr:PRC-barrel domain-containing protein [archaeon]
MRIAKELIGKEVMNSEASLVGKVIDIDLEFVDNEVNNLSLIVSKKGIQETLNIKKGELVIPWDFVKKIGDKLILDYNFEGNVKSSKVKSSDDINDNFGNVEDVDVEEEELDELRSRV